jgi:hypothetical protein
VRREAGRQLVRLRELAEDSGQKTSTFAKATADEEDGEQTLTVVVGELRRLRYGRRETWPEPRGVFKRAKRERKAMRR